MQFKQYNAQYEIDGLKFVVSVIGEKSSYGRKRYHITPKDGQGQKWVGVGITKLTKAQ